VVARNGSKTTRSIVAALVGSALVWGMLGFAGMTLKPHMIGAIKMLRNRPSPMTDPIPASGWIRPGDSILAEDPCVALASDRFPPVILDAWARCSAESTAIRIGSATCHSGSNGENST
jgi:hypothetical protein